MNAGPVASETLEPIVLHCDEDLVVLNKPGGLLSVPGKTVNWSVQSWLAQSFPEATGPLLTHRLDMSTSGLMLATLHASAHKRLQHQFIKRTIEKRYVALLSKLLRPGEYVVDLPLRVDVDNRPRQTVCFSHGKQAFTRAVVTNTEGDSSRVEFFPQTGRTHQLRVHAADPRGLNAAIVGDELYGSAGERLMLHADCLRFRHPGSGEFMEICSPAPF